MTMRMDVITLFPAMFDAVTRYGVSGRAVSNGLLDCHFWDLRLFTDDPSKRLDDRPYGGGPGMVLRAEPLYRAVEAARAERKDDAPVVYFSPQGKVLKQADVRDIAAGPGCILVAGRYEGVDERWLELQVDEQWSIGHYVLSGGEIPAMVVLDAVARLQPGALGNEDSALEDSFGVDNLVEGPQYTRPQQFRGREVPPVLLSGDHGRIAEWRHRQSVQRIAKQQNRLAEAEEG